jgi:hypothetical protein
LIDEYIGNFFEEIILIIAATAGSTIFAYFRSIRNKQIENALALNKIHLRSWQIEKAILMLAKLTANQTKQAHPEIDTSSLEEVVKELMKDKSELNPI